MIKYKVYYYTSGDKSPIKDFLDSLQKTQKAKILRIFQYFQEYGIEAITSHTKKLSGTPLWEIRILGKDNIRIIYVLPDRSKLIVLHGFTKKTQRTTAKNMNIALQRYKELESRS